MLCIRVSGRMSSKVEADRKMAQLKGLWRAGRTLVGLGLAWTAAFSTTRASAEGFRVIVNGSNPVNEMARTEVARCYLGGQRRWANGQLLVPIDQSTKSEVRKAFSQQVLQLDVEAVQVQWMRAISAGAGRPPLSASEADVIEAVGKDPRVIAYVSADTVLPPNIKAIAIRE